MKLENELFIRTDNGQGGDNPLFIEVSLTSYTYNRPRMGMPKLTATLMYKDCLDKRWTGHEYVELDGERYYVSQPQSSSLSNTDQRYKHELELRSERDDLLGNIYAVDAVYPNATTAYKPCSNSTDIKFYGPITEFADRFNCILRAAGVGDSILNTKTDVSLLDSPVGDGYVVIVDQDSIYDIEATKEISVSEKKLWDFLTYAYEQYEIPFEFVGKKIIFGSEPKTVSKNFEYGFDSQLLSVNKKNANAQIVNRITGTGSSENIPYYYPNDTEYGNIEIQCPSSNQYLKASLFKIVNYRMFLYRVRASDTVTYVRYQGVYRWKVGDKYYNNLAELGLEYAQTITSNMMGESLSWTALPRIPFQNALMPPIYRGTNGAERFYNALNNTYPNPDAGGNYVFPNPFVKGFPSEYIHKDDKIKPTIEGISNASNKLFGEIAAIAYDDDDNDKLIQQGDDGDALKYEHSYFYIKLNQFNGEYGFNLFQYIIQSDPMTVQMTSGPCNGCKFKVHAVERTAADGFNTYDNPVQTEGAAAGIVAGNYAQKVNKNNIQPWQQDTSKFPIWICLQKDVETMGTILPSQERNIKPAVGDTFNIINIELPKSYLLNAEARLKDALIKKMADNNEAKFTFDISISRIFLKENPSILEELTEYSKINVVYNGYIYNLFVSAINVKVSANSPLPDISVSLTDTITVGESFVQSVAKQAVAMIPNNTRSFVTNEAAEQRYLSKRHADRTPFPLNTGDDLTAEQGVQFGAAFASGLAGFGGRIDGEGHGELRSLILNEYLEVPELRYNRVDVSTGTEWHAPGGGLIESVDTATKTCVLKLENGEAGAVAVGDLCLGIWHFTEDDKPSSVMTGSDSFGNSTVDVDNEGLFRFKGFATIYFEITSVSSDTKSFTYKLRDGYTYHPQPSLNFVSYGNRTKTSRQKSRYSTRTYERYLSGVNDWTFGPTNIMAQFGDLSNLNLGNDHDMTGYSAYLNNVYMTGRFHNIDNPVVERWLDISPNIVVEHQNGTFTPENVTFSAYARYQDGTIVKVSNPDIRHFNVDEYDYLITDEVVDVRDISEGEFVWIGDDVVTVYASAYFGIAKDGKDGAKGDQGDQGLDGKIMRVTEWMTGTSYHNDHTPDASGQRYLDIVSHNGSHWVCKSNHTSSANNAPGTTGGANYWNEMNAAAPIYTSLLVANEASIRLINAGEIIVTDKNNAVCGRFGAGEKPFWLGGSQSNSVASFDSRGTLTLNGTDSSACQIQSDPNTGDLLIKNKSTGNVLTRMTGQAISGGGAVSDTGTRYHTTNSYEHGATGSASGNTNTANVFQFAIPSAGSGAKTVNVKISASVWAWASPNQASASCTLNMQVGYMNGSTFTSVASKTLSSGTATTSSPNKTNSLTNFAFSQFTVPANTARTYYVRVTMTSSFGSLASAGTTPNYSGASTLARVTAIDVEVHGTEVYKTILHRDGLLLSQGVNDYFTAYANSSTGFHALIENAKAATDNRHSPVGIGINHNGVIVRVARDGADDDWIPLRSYLAEYIELNLRQWGLIK